MKDYKSMTVGEIVADNFKNSEVFYKFGIDFCCGGNISISDACNKVNVKIEDILEELDKMNQSIDKRIDFKSWDLDLIIDFVLKFHHRYIRENGDKIQVLINKVSAKHGDTHPSLFQVKSLFDVSLVELNAHLVKEETVLFPYIYEMHEAYSQNAGLPYFHCGSVIHPIAVMMDEHENEGDRFREIARLTNNYTAPDGACNSYRLMLDLLSEFESNLHHHIHLENNVIFPASVELQQSLGI